MTILHKLEILLLIYDYVLNPSKFGFHFLMTLHNPFIIIYGSPITMTLNDHLSQDPNLEETPPTISCHALSDIVTLQTLNIQGYIKNKKVAIFIDSGSTHNFINYKLEKDLNFFVYPTPEFQVMIENGGTIN